MAVSRIIPSGGANDFNIALSGAYTRVTFSKEFPAGGYTIVSSAGDTTLDIYSFNQDGTSAGYTGTKSFSATKGFNKMVILGGQNGDLLSFTFKQTFVSEAESDEVTAGPVLTSLSTSSMPNIDNTVTLTGRNFAPNMTVTFTGTNSTALNAKSIVVGTTTSAVVTRPDNLSTAFSPYTITISNPGVSDPAGSSSNILTNAITAGASPVWSTSATLAAYTKGVSYSATVVATDADAGTTITYSVVSNGLPSGLTFATTSGVISGTATVVDSGTITIRATDGGGNYVDRTFTVPNVGSLAPSWTTGATLPGLNNGSAYSQAVVATDDSGLTPTYSTVSGSLPTGLSFNTSTGVFSGTPSGMTIGQAFSYTVRATDTNGTYTDRTFILSAPIVGVFTSTGSFTMPSTKNLKVLCVGAGAAGLNGGHSNGGGSGYVNYYQIGSVASGATVTATVGAPNGGTTTLSISGGSSYSASGGSGTNGGSGGGGHGNAGFGGAGGSNGSNGNSGATAGGGAGQGVPFPLANVQYPAVNYGFTAGSGGNATGGSHCGGGGGGGVSATNAVGFSIPGVRSSGLGGTTGGGFGGGGAAGGYNGNYYPGIDGQPGMIYVWEY